MVLSGVSVSQKLTADEPHIALITAIELEGFMMQQYFLIAICHLQHPLSIAAIWVKRRRFSGIDKVNLGPAQPGPLRPYRTSRRASTLLGRTGPGRLRLPRCHVASSCGLLSRRSGSGRSLYSVQRTAGVEHRAFHDLGHTPASFVPRLPVRVSMRMAMRCVHLTNRNAGPAILPQPSGALPDMGFGNPVSDCSIGGFTPATGRVC